MLGLTVSLICLLLATLYIFFKRRCKYWKDLGVPGPEPTMVVGNMKDLFSLKVTEPEMMDQWYKEYRNEPYIGYYNLWKPTLFIIDPELVKSITENDFNHFIDHPDLTTNTENDSILDSLFTMKGAQWKGKRQIFSKLFNPKKLKELSNILKQHNDSLVRVFDEQIKSSDEVELMDILEKHILKAITSFMYSMDSAHNQETHKNLSQLSESFMRPTGSAVVRFLLFTVFPEVYRQFGISSFPRVFFDYYSKFTNDLLNSRNGMRQEPEDLVAIVGKMRNGELESKKIEYREAVGHLFTFLFAAHHTTMTTLSYAIYQLSLHPEIQEKLRAEVDSVLNGKDFVSYDSLQELTYLEAVINETLRMFPLLGVLKRTCTQPYKVNDKLTIPEGMDITLPVYSIHKDPEYFPEPEKFIPERFSDAEKTPVLFMPFGKGPRMCIGKRFAYISMKTVLATMVSEYIILPGTKTRNPIVFDTKTFFISAHPVDGLHVRLQKRK